MLLHCIQKCTFSRCANECEVDTPNPLHNSECDVRIDRKYRCYVTLPCDFCTVHRALSEIRVYLFRKTPAVTQQMMNVNSEKK